MPDFLFPSEESFRERRALIGDVRFFSDERNRAVVTTRSEREGELKAGLPGAGYYDSAGIYFWVGGSWTIRPSSFFVT